ncbi:mandelate racemase/muconate lactonizing enzyme family protein [Bacillus sp. T33-2]|uniref:mandelate racemase/muconate lactonizing enzyme family protein n=1 Tax=Bacillus sp. T33-2 TaxID=2054168 RepID=UPI000C7933F6|nr:mandelate racemase/muconate lactonizing enzyme family protein [Bacillus sp. T33-2]PLR91139.1 mandelate racemase/muconate lactonizing enzyme family protein [Bacillus sp. T33-2]
MQIDRVETYPLLHKISTPYGDANGYKQYRSCYLIRIITKSGIDGWGECIDWLPTLHLGFTQRIIPYIVGKNASDRLKLVSTISKLHQRAAAAISMALTEIAAKSANISVCDLWGGKQRDMIPVYASLQSYTDKTDWIDHSLQAVEKTMRNGFNQLKVKVGGRMIKEDFMHIEKIQGKLGEKVWLILDANQSYDLAAARQWERHFSNWDNVLWMEEPLPLNNLREYQLLRSCLSVPIAGGENLKNAKEFLKLLMNNSFDMIQPDILHGKGVEDFRDSLQLARHFGARVSPHSYDGSVSRLHTLFCQAVLSSWTKMDGEKIEPLEWDVMENPFSDLVPIKPISGKVSVPDGTGIGVEVDTELIHAYLWDGSTY